MASTNEIEYENLPFQPASHSYDSISDVAFYKQSSIKLLYLNARSLINKTSDLKFILDEIKNYICVIAISETWLNDNDTKYFNFSGYNAEFACRPNKRGGGAGFLILENLKYEIIKKYSNDDTSFLTIKVFINNIPYLITVFYRRPDRRVSSIETFLNQLDDHLNSVSDLNSFIVGDFNFNIFDLNSDQYVYNYMNIMKSNNYYICDNLTPTRECSNTLLDHIFTNNVNQTIVIHHAKYDLMDHNLIFIEVSSAINTTSTSSNVSRTTYKTFTDYGKLRDNLIQHPVIINTNENTAKMYDDFLDQLNANITASSKSFKSKFKLKNTKPWFTSELKTCIQAKNFWYTKFSKDRSNQQLKNEYKFWQNKYTNLRKKTKKTYFQHNFEKAEHSTKNTWKCIYDVIYDGDPPSHTTKILNNCLESDKQNTIDNLNMHFCSVGRTLSESIINNRSYMVKPSLNHFQFRYTNPFEILKIIKSLKNSRSIGPDGLSIDVFKKCSDLLAHPISTIINKSFSESSVPAKLKISKTVPVFKSGPVDDYNNYRPISLLPITEKILESVVMNQLNAFLRNKSTLYNNQYGFREQSNTNTALFDIVTNIQSERDLKKVVGIIFIDLKKAFDALDRNILMKKLLGIGCKGSSYKWFKSYLTDRTQYTQINHLISKTEPITYGVPQGSKAGPTLFNIFCNDLKDINFMGKIYMYADDIVLLYSDNIHVIQQNMNSDLDCLSNWMHLNKLTVNALKTKYMLIGSHPSEICIKYGQTKIEGVTVFKYLGVHLDSNMKFDIHIKKLTSKLSSICGMFKRIKWYVPDNVKRSIFFALFGSHINYAILVYGATYKTKLAKLQVIQNKAIKSLFNYSYRSNNITMHNDLNILPVQYTAKLHQTTHIYNIKQSNIHSNTTLINQQTAYNTRNPSLIRPIKINTTTYGTNSPLYKAVMAYNALPEAIKNSEHFKNSVKKYFFEQFFINNSLN